MNRRSGAYGIIVLLLGMLLCGYRSVTAVPDSPVPVPTEIRQTPGKGTPLGKTLPDSRKDRIARLTVTSSLSTIFPVPAFLHSELGTTIRKADAETLTPGVANVGRTCHFPHLFPTHYFW